ncbi:MAG: winged helix-turn-helix transcriptional regulator [Ramlibacter sp.]|nr:winged helix-turn-helix transcriptional regulator [Ramlibacter sp.]
MNTAVKSAGVTPQGCTNIKLRQLMRRVAQHYDAEVGKTGLKGTQYSLLSYVYKLGPLRPVDLAREMKIDASTLSRNLRPLLTAGWLIQNEGADARSHLISITPSGREKRQEAQRRWRVAQEGINELLGPANVVALHALIDESLARLTPADEGDSHDE